jgi:ribosomal protein L31E
MAQAAQRRMLLTINIRKYLVTQPRNKRARKAVKYIRERVSHFTKTQIENVKISQDLNSLIVRKFSKRMVPVKLNVKMEGGKATVEPFAAEKIEKATTTETKKGEKKTEKKAAAPKTTVQEKK